MATLMRSSGVAKSLSNQRCTNSKLDILGILQRYNFKFIKLISAVHTTQVLVIQVYFAI